VFENKIRIYSIGVLKNIKRVVRYFEGLTYGGVK